jgi:hypothetical protein
VPAPAILRLGDLSASAALRSPPPGIDPAWISPRLPPALERRARFQSAFTSGTPPSDWMAWTRDALIAEDDWHRGTAGTVDENLYALLRSYMAHAAAPGRAVRTLGFLHDMATWNLPAAGQSADSLIAWSVAAEEWFPAGPLLDAAVAARLLAGDTVGARRALEALAPLAVRDGRDPHDLRTRLLAAWVDRAERARAPAPLR